MRMVHTDYLHFALGIELVGVGGMYENDWPLLLLWEQDCYRFGLVCQETGSGYRVLCGAFKGQHRPSSQRTLKRLDNSSSEC
jgi:hypothetical protein